MLRVCGRKVDDEYCCVCVCGREWLREVLGVWSECVEKKWMNG